jgi:hypothetical protein
MWPWRRNGRAFASARIVVVLVTSRNESPVLEAPMSKLLDDPAPMTMRPPFCTPATRLKELGPPNVMLVLVIAQTLKLGPWQVPEPMLNVPAPKEIDAPSAPIFTLPEMLNVPDPNFSALPEFEMDPLKL